MDYNCEKNVVSNLWKGRVWQKPKYSRELFGATSREGLAQEYFLYSNCFSHPLSKDGLGSNSSVSHHQK